ncbi:hypothetical protein AB0B94_04995 [Micromonospora sp. NPDC048986]|uniref:hypothetical protein n=1 Tax=Micromonospora sp. NPDC048986 TaxID=3155644 RepID=UPI00340A20EC
MPAVLVRATDPLRFATSGVSRRQGRPGFTKEEWITHLLEAVMRAERAGLDAGGAGESAWGHRIACGGYVECRSFSHKTD